MMKLTIRLTTITTIAAMTCSVWAGDEPGTVAGEGSVSPDAGGEAGADDLAMQLANPLAALISMPIQANYDSYLGDFGGGNRWLINVQPVIPFTINDDWNLISRTIVPIIDQSGYVDPTFNVSGFGDIVQSLWLSPAKPVNGWIVGAGGAFLLPTATETVLGADKWGLGPTVVALKQIGPWTIGGLSNHIATVGGDSTRPDVNATFVQPFITYVTPSKTSFALNTEATYDWGRSQWSVPINAMVSQMIKVGDQPVQLQAGVRYWADSSNQHQDGTWGLRMSVVFLFPK